MIYSNLLLLQIIDVFIVYGRYLGLELQVKQSKLNYIQL
jgi:hypothetical protein